jgi:hypothetical protein
MRDGSRRKALKRLQQGRRVVARKRAQKKTLRVRPQFSRNPAPTEADNSQIKEWFGLVL